MNHDKGFKIQAIQLSVDIGIRRSSEQLGIPITLSLTSDGKEHILQ